MVMQVLSREHVRMLVWERGAGRTLACGTGACAVVVAGILEGKLSRSCRCVQQPPLGATPLRVIRSCRPGSAAWFSQHGCLPQGGPARWAARDRVERSRQPRVHDGAGRAVIHRNSLPELVYSDDVLSSLRETSLSPTRFMQPNFGRAALPACQQSVFCMPVRRDHGEKWC